MKKWEYLIWGNVDITKNIEKELADMGDRGWELASIQTITFNKSETVSYIFKREKQNESPENEENALLRYYKS